MQKAGRAGRRGLDDQGHVLVRVDVGRVRGDEAATSSAISGVPTRRCTRSFNLSWNSRGEPGRAPESWSASSEVIERSFLSWHQVRTAAIQAGAGREPGGRQDHQRSPGARRPAGCDDRQPARTGGVWRSVRPRGCSFLQQHWLPRRGARLQRRCPGGPAPPDERDPGRGAGAGGLLGRARPAHPLRRLLRHRGRAPPLGHPQLPGHPRATAG